MPARSRETMHEEVRNEVEEMQRTRRGGGGGVTRRAEKGTKEARTRGS